MQMKVNPTTGAWAPYGYIWEYNVTLASWILVVDAEVQAAAETYPNLWKS